MLEAMFNAKVGDDVFREDPTVNELEHKVADMFGHEDGLFCASGTMSNQIAIKCHTQPGDEIICDALSHVHIYEGGGIAFNSGCATKTIQGERGQITANQIEEAINPEDVHKPHSRLVSIENTANRGGGSIYDYANLQAIREVCLKNNLKLHLDGARLWNAMVAAKQLPKDHGKLFDSISLCFSKGLGAPVGSVLIGSKEFISRARRVRKVFGGGMRQAGYLAAACIYALNHHINRLEEDHRHAKLIAQHLMKRDFTGKVLPVETNMIIFELKGRFSAQSFADMMAEHDVKCIAISSSQVRMVTHLGVTPSMVENLIGLIDRI